MKTRVFQRGLLLGVTLLVGMPLSAAAKCRNFLQPLFVIDGRQATEAEFIALTTVHAELIAALEIRCWDPADRTLNLLGTGMPVTFVLTKPLMQRLIGDLQQLSVAQRDFFAKHETFSARFRDLGAKPLSDGVSIKLSTGPTGWAATATKAGMVHVCAVFEGDAPVPATQRSLNLMSTELVTDPVAGVPACYLSIDSTGQYALDPGR